MITERELRELVDFRSKGAPVLSLYLNVDLTRRDKGECQLALKGLLKKAADKVLRQDARRVKRFFDFEYDWQDRGIAIFSCQGQGFWRVYPLSIPVGNGIFIGERPHIKPLTELLDEYKRHCVVLVGREQARIFLLHLGDIEEHSGALSAVPGHHKQGGWAQARYQRHIEGQAQRNLKRAAEITADFFEREGCSHLILGGTEENLAQFQGMLPKSSQERVIGSLPIEMTASEKEVLDRSLELISGVERRRERELVKRMITTATKGGAAVIGLADTLGAVREGRVHILIVADGYTAKGYRCANCGYLAAQKMRKCPFCGGEVSQIDDVVNLIVRRVMEGGGQVEAVKDSVALKEAGSIGAILRY